MVIKEIKARLFLKSRPVSKWVGHKVEWIPPLHSFLLRAYSRVFFTANFSRMPLRTIPNISVPTARLWGGAESNNKLVVFDSQCIQSGSFFRGIGRYSNELIRSFSKHNPDIQVVLFFNNFSNESNIHEFLRQIEGVLPNIWIYISRVQVTPDMPLTAISKEITQEIANLGADCCISLSVFEHPFNVIPLEPGKIKNHGAIYYDIIPWIFPKLFLISKDAKCRYLEQVETLLKLDFLLSISQRSIDHLIQHFSSIPPHVIIHGSGYASSQADFGKPLSQRSGVFCVGSISKHKNLRGLIEAYGFLQSELQSLHPLYIAGVSSTSERHALKNFALKHQVKVTLLERISEEELNNFYESTRVTVVPSFEEGFGMPVLEAWNKGAVVIGSSNTAIAEILGSESVQFNPYDTRKIGFQLSKYLADDHAWKIEQERILNRRNTFSWERSSTIMIDFLRSLTK